MTFDLVISTYIDSNIRQLGSNIGTNIYRLYDLGKHLTSIALDFLIFK